MVKLAIAAATSELAREVIDKLVATGKHEIIGLIRKDPAQLPTLPGVTWVQTTYEDESELVKLLEGVHTVLCFLAVHHDPGNTTQKRIIDAAVKAGVKRFAPSEWSTGVKLETELDAIPWYAGKVEVSQYLEQLNKEKKVLGYCRFQVGSFMNYIGHPHRTAKHMTTIPGLVNVEAMHALIVEGSLGDYMSYTTVEDIANVVTLAVDYKGEWPTVGGIRGDRITVGELVEIGQNVRGKPFTIEPLKMEDLEAGVLKTENYLRLNLPSIPKDQIEGWSKMATAKTLIAISRGLWDVSDEWNCIFPDYKFTKVEEFSKVWEGK